MNAAEIAVGISIGSLIISIVSLVWNIWSKFIFPKPNLIVSFSLMQIFDAEHGLHSPFLNLSITNHGPIPAIISGSYITMSKGFLSNGVFKREKASGIAD
jgi:hypothetical protein